MKRKIVVLLIATTLLVPSTAYGMEINTAQLSENSSKALNAVQDVINDCNIIDDYMDDYEKVEAVCNYLADTVEYSLEYNGSKTVTHSVYGTLVNHVAVCQGYSLSFQLMMDELGIESEYVVGYTKDGLHSWNRVKVNGTWYWVDPTYYDLGFTDCYNEMYFLHKKLWKGRTIVTEQSSSEMPDYFWTKYFLDGKGYKGR